MIIRWQCGYRPGYKDLSHKLLALSQDLMRLLEPSAEFHVTWQYEAPPQRPDTIYHFQDSVEPLTPTWGQFLPPRHNINDHEVWLDNDHIMWDLPVEWALFKQAPDKCLVYRTGFGYHGMYTYKIRHYLSCGFFGLPPGIAPDIHSGYEEDSALTGKPLRSYNHDQEQMGGLSYFLCQNFDDAHMLFIDEAHEVPVYNHLSAEGWQMHRRRWGRYGVHLSGTNGGSYDPSPIMDHIREMMGLGFVGKAMPRPGTKSL